MRVVWTSSQTVELSAPKGGMLIADLTSPPQDQTKNYVASKTGNWFLASELARKVGLQGILNVVQNPGNLKTNLLRHAPVWMRLAASPLLHNAKQGAYTELWAGLSPELHHGYEWRLCDTLGKGPSVAAPGSARCFDEGRGRWYGRGWQVSGVVPAADVATGSLLYSGSEWVFCISYN